jgi:hypothetical protein
MNLKVSSKEGEGVGVRETPCRRPATEDRQTRFEFTRLIIVIFMFVSVRGPLFRVEDLTAMGWNRLYVWRALNSLVKAGILEKFDRKSYGITDDARKWFRTAFGGGVNDASFAYSTMAVETWSEMRLDRFKSKLSEIWEERPERVKQDPARFGLTLNQADYSSLTNLLNEKIEEASYVASMLKKRTDTDSAK